MNSSKIFRSLVVVGFIALIVFIGYNDVMLIIKGGNSNGSLNILKIIYIIVLAMLVLAYVYIKDKMYKYKFKKTTSFFLRYTYTLCICIGMSIVAIYNDLDKISSGMLFIYILYKIIISIVLKKIIFNVSKSDILSILVMFVFAMMPSSYGNTTTMIFNLTNTFFVFITILFIQRLIDELKQKGVKTKKYLLMSSIIGCLVSLCIIMGINAYVWIIFALLSIIITCNLDRTHIYFPKKITINLNSKFKDILYKLERININKLIISIIVITVISTLLTKIGNIVLSNINILGDVYQGTLNIKELIAQINVYSIKDNAFNSTNTILSFSRTYYLVIIAYIIFIEVLSIFLHRRYDTKSTLMKLFFILFYLSIQVFNLDITMYHTTFSVFMILISIINTSNIYLNREERIKMLAA